MFPRLTPCVKCARSVKMQHEYLEQRKQGYVYLVSGRSNTLEQHEAAMRDGALNVGGGF